jgi:hypothetical protein
MVVKMYQVIELVCSPLVGRHLIVYMLLIIEGVKGVQEID